MTSRIRHVAVLIPARDEEELLPRCIRSVQAACRHLPANISSDIVVAADCCVDSTREVAGKLLRAHGTVVCTTAGAVGRARSLAAAVALRRYAGPPAGCWLANTDADCDVPPDWLLHQLKLASRGLDAVAGVVDVDAFTGHSAAVRERFRLTYRIHADGSHPHVHGANLGIRADAYLRAGGWGEQATAEDHDLWRRLKETGCRTLSDARLQILTSGRRIGRAPHGFAEALAAHNETAETAA